MTEYHNVPVIVIRKLIEKINKTLKIWSISYTEWEEPSDIDPMLYCCNDDDMIKHYYELLGSQQGKICILRPDKLNNDTDRGAILIYPSQNIFATFVHQTILEYLHSSLYNINIPMGMVTYDKVPKEKALKLIEKLNELKKDGHGIYMDLTMHSSNLIGKQTEDVVREYRMMSDSKEELKITGLFDFNNNGKYTIIVVQRDCVFTNLAHDVLGDPHLQIEKEMDNHEENR